MSTRSISKKSFFCFSTSLAVIWLTATVFLGVGVRNATANEPVPTPVCVAIRGNGELIFAHFPALARMAEHFGPFEGVAGGSSGSITSFLTESMHMHPLLNDCGNGSCTREEAGARLALMYKSIDGFLIAAEYKVLHDTIDALNDIVEAIGDDVDALLADEKEQEAWDLLLPELKALGNLINQEPLELVANSNNPKKHIPQVWASIKHILSFEASDPLILVRPGMINFPGLAKDFGDMGSFFAGYGAYNSTAWKTYFDNCAMPGRGKSPDEVTALPMQGSLTCGNFLQSMALTWINDLVVNPLPEEAGKNRIYDRIGENFRTLAITSVMIGDAATSFTIAKDKYFFDATDYEPDVDFETMVKAGYWGESINTQAVEGNPKQFPDMKSSMALALPASQWKDILSVSPAEPGLSRALEIKDKNGNDVISAGGWADLAPVLALKNAGCGHVVYVTRQGQESTFAQGVTKLLGSSEEQREALFDLNDPASSFSLSLQEAAGVYCTDWDSHSVFSDPDGLINDAWNAPFEIHDSSLIPVWGPVHGQTDSAGLPGCTPGVTKQPGNILFMLIPTLSTLSQHQ